jgi:hypothetical protein
LFSWWCYFLDRIVFYIVISIKPVTECPETGIKLQFTITAFQTFKISVDGF